MKHFYSSIIFLAQCTTLFGHGFHTTTSVLLPDNTLQSINTLCYRAQKKKFFTASYDTASAQNTEAQVVRSGRSKTNCYIQLELQKEEGVSHLCNTVSCTPTQEFYADETHQWVPAYKLKIGDELLCARNKTATVSSIKLINEAINVYTIEVERSHAFFVSECLILTHNMILPMAFHVGLSIPFSAGIGGTFGCVLGPPTVFAGAAVGCIIGTVATIMYCGKVPCYNLEPYNIPFLKQCLNLQPKTEFAEAPCEPKMTTFTDQVATCIDSQGTQVENEPKRTLNKPLIYTNDKDDSNEKISKVLEGATPAEKTKRGTRVYLKPKKYRDAVKDFESMKPNNVRNIKNGDGLAGSLPDGRQVNVRKTSKGNHKGENLWPTLEIQNTNRSRNKIKVRYIEDGNGQHN